MEKYIFISIFVFGIMFYMFYLGQRSCRCRHRHSHKRSYYNPYNTYQYFESRPSHPGFTRNAQAVAQPLSKPLPHQIERHPL